MSVVDPGSSGPAQDKDKDPGQTPPPTPPPHKEAQQTASPVKKKTSKLPFIVVTDTQGNHWLHE